MSKSIYTLDMRDDIDHAGGGGGPIAASDVSYTNISGQASNVYAALHSIETDLGSAEADIETLKDNTLKMPDYFNVLQRIESQTYSAQTEVYTATSDCWVVVLMQATATKAAICYIKRDGILSEGIIQNGGQYTIRTLMPLKAGDILVVDGNSTRYAVTVYATL